MLPTMKRPGRPLIGPKAQAHVYQEIHDAVEKEARERKVPRADVWREVIIAGYLARRGDS